MITFGETQSPSLPSTLPDSHHHDKLQPGKYVACIYDKEWYVGSIVERSDEQNDVLIDGMKLSSTRLLSWPSVSRKDQCWVQFQDIICVIGAPELQGHF